MSPEHDRSPAQFFVSPKTFHVDLPIHEQIAEPTRLVEREIENRE
jgi:hypothetical protein